MREEELVIWIFIGAIALVPIIGDLYETFLQIRSAKSEDNSSKPKARDKPVE